MPTNESRLNDSDYRDYTACNVYHLSRTCLSAAILDAKYENILCIAFKQTNPRPIIKYNCANHKRKNFEQLYRHKR